MIDRPQKPPTPGTSTTGTPGDSSGYTPRNFYDDDLNDTPPIQDGENPDVSADQNEGEGGETDAFAEGDDAVEASDVDANEDDFSEGMEEDSQEEGMEEGGEDTEGGEGEYIVEEQFDGMPPSDQPPPPPFWKKHFLPLTIGGVVILLLGAFYLQFGDSLFGSPPPPPPPVLAKVVTPPPPPDTSGSLSSTGPASLFPQEPTQRPVLSGKEPPKLDQPSRLLPNKPRTTTSAPTEVPLFPPATPLPVSPSTSPKTIPTPPSLETPPAVDVEAVDINTETTPPPPTEGTENVVSPIPAEEPSLPLPTEPVMPTLANQKPSLPSPTVSPVEQLAVEEPIPALAKGDRLGAVEKSLDELRTDLRSLQEKLVLLEASSPATDVAQLKQDIAQLRQTLETRQMTQVPATSEKEATAPERPWPGIDTAPKSESKPKPKAPKKIAAAPAKPSPVSSVWTLRSATYGQAWVKSKTDPGLERRIVPGDTLAGVGRIISVEKVDGRWVVTGTNGKIR